MSKTYILFLIDSLSGGGAESIVLRLVDFLHSLDLNIQVSVITRKSLNKDIQYLQSRGVAVYDLNSTRTSPIGIIKFLFILFRFPRHILIHAHLSWFLYLLPLVRLMGFKILFLLNIIHYSRRKFYFLKYYEIICYYFIARISCISKATKVELISWLNLNHIEDKLTVIYNGIEVNPQPKCSRRKPSKHHKLLSVGSLSYQKGHDLLISSISSHLLRILN